MRQNKQICRSKVYLFGMIKEFVEHEVRDGDGDERKSVGLQTNPIKNYLDVIVLPSGL